MACVKYFKRYRMELDLPAAPRVPELPPGLAWVPWREDLVEAHAWVKYLSFCGEIDAEVFPSLAHPAGCAELMRAIRAKSGFCPAATWLVVDEQAGEGCGTVQGLSDGSGCGAIQNLGVVPARRGMGLGTALMLKALAGFWQAGLRRASLEVTASNEPAVRMYRRLGFRCHKTVYRAVERVGLGRPPAPHGPERPEPVMAEGEVGR